MYVLPFFFLQPFCFLQNMYMLHPVSSVKGFEQFVKLTVISNHFKNVLFQGIALFGEFVGDVPCADNLFIILLLYVFLRTTHITPSPCSISLRPTTTVYRFEIYTHVRQMERIRGTAPYSLRLSARKNCSLQQ